MVWHMVLNAIEQVDELQDEVVRLRAAAETNLRQATEDVSAQGGDNLLLGADILSGTPQPRRVIALHSHGRRQRA